MYSLSKIAFNGFYLNIIIIIMVSIWIHIHQKNTEGDGGGLAGEREAEGWSGKWAGALPKNSAVQIKLCCAQKLWCLWKLRQNKWKNGQVVLLKFETKIMKTVEIWLLLKLWKLIRSRIDNCWLVSAPRTTDTTLPLRKSRRTHWPPRIWPRRRK